MSIRVEGLSKNYGSQVALNAVNFDIPSGQVVGFLGPNGAGKSTTMKLLTCYLSPSAGEAWVNGNNIQTQILEVQKCIGYLPEHNPLYTEMYVREYLLFVAQISGLKRGIKDRIEEIIDITGLRKEARKKINQLSKGYRQRVGLAQALIHDPKVLILDEPTSGLDPNQVGEMRQLITTLGEDKTVLLSTHIMQEVEAMCDRVIIIDNGNIVADDLLSNLRGTSSGFVFKVRFKKPMEIGKLSALKGVASVESLANHVYLLKAKDGIDMEEKLFALAVETGNIILEQGREMQSLEHVFKSLTKQKKKHA
jgi:ABC-2 type transport system ATP-binding protein